MEPNKMKLICTMTSGALLALIQTQTHATGDAALFAGSMSDTREYLQIAEYDDRQDRRQERGRSDERHDRRDCRRDEGYVGKDKRDCKQEEVRDGVRGNQGGSDND